MALQGAEILFYPTAIGSEPQDFNLDSRDHWKRVMQGHAGANVVSPRHKIGSIHFFNCEIYFCLKMACPTWSLYSPLEKLPLLPLPVSSHSSIYATSHLFDIDLRFCALFIKILADYSCNPPISLAEICPQLSKRINFMTSGRAYLR